MKPILITGATGNIGSHVVSQLRALKQNVRIATRSKSPSSEYTSLDFLQPETYRDALSGCAALFLLRPPAISNTKKTLNVFIDTAFQEGINHIVFVSVAGAENNSIVPHHAVEQHLIRSGESFTILRPGFFSQNIGAAYRKEILFRDRIFLPSGNGLINFTDTRDIAKVAVKTLLSPQEHCEKAYTLAGNQAVSFCEVARILSKVLNRSIVYQEASAIRYFAHLVKDQMPITQAFVQTIIHAGIRKGQANIVDPSLSQLLEGKPVSIEEYIHEHKELWCS